MKNYDDWEKEFDRRMRAVDHRIGKVMDQVDQRMEEVNKRVDEVTKRAEEAVEAEIKRNIMARNEAQEWTHRRVFCSKTCVETGEKIKPFSPAYFKDQWDPFGNKHRYWITEEAHTWKVLRDDNDV